MNQPELPNCKPFILTCERCDNGDGITSREQAESEGWTGINEAWALSANFVGLCPICGEKEAKP